MMTARKGRAGGSASRDGKQVEHSSSHSVSQDSSQDPQGRARWCPKDPPQEFWTQAAEHRDSLQGGCVAGGGGQRSLRPSSPGANSGHKLCVGQRSDFQRCHKGILKRNWYRERCRACLSASSPPAVALHPQGLGLGNSVPAECMQGRGDIIQQPLPQDAGQPGRSDEPLGRALCRERQELTRQWDT